MTLLAIIFLPAGYLLANSCTVAGLNKLPVLFCYDSLEQCNVAETALNRISADRGSCEKPDYCFVELVNSGGVVKHNTACFPTLNDCTTNQAKAVEVVWQCMSEGDFKKMDAKNHGYVLNAKNTSKPAELSIVFDSENYCQSMVQACGNSLNCALNDLYQCGSLKLYNAKSGDSNYFTSKIKEWGSAQGAYYDLPSGFTQSELRSVISVLVSKEATSVPSCSDQDADKICDSDDECPTDPLNKCKSQGCDKDADGDGICDDKDNCPNDPDNKCQKKSEQPPTPDESECPTEGECDEAGSPPQTPEEFKSSLGLPTLDNPIQSNDVRTLLGKLIDAFISIAIIVSLLALIYLGFQFVSAQGNDEKLKKAKQNALYVTIGLVIVLSARVIVAIIDATLNALQ